MVYFSNKLLLSSKKEQAFETWDSMGESRNCRVAEKKPRTTMLVVPFT